LPVNVKPPWVDMISVLNFSEYYLLFHTEYRVLKLTLSSGEIREEQMRIDTKLSLSCTFMLLIAVARCLSQSVHTMPDGGSTRVRWQQLDGPCGGTVTSLAISPGGNIIGFSRDPCLSTDQGMTRTIIETVSFEDVDRLEVTPIQTMADYLGRKEPPGSFFVTSIRSCDTGKDCSLQRRSEECTGRATMA